MNWGNLLFGFEGRINRAKYWLAVLIYIVVSVFIQLIGLSLGPQSIPLTILHVIVGVGTFISGIAVGIKRLHDRNKTGWWLLIFYIVPTLLFGTAMMLGLASAMHGSSVGGSGAMISFLLGFAIIIWAFIELGCLRGTAGQNRYGPDPLPAVA